MKIFSLILSLISLSTAAFADSIFKIQPRSFLLSTHYDIYSEDQWIGSIEKEALRIDTVYSVFDEKGHPLATGTSPFFSSGTLLSSMTRIKVTDDRGLLIGKIEGEFLTTASGKFAFFNRRGDRYATLYVDRNYRGAALIDAAQSRQPIAIFRRSYVPYGDYYWEVKVIDDKNVDLCMLYVFGAFLTDAWEPRKPTQDKDLRWQNMAIEAIVEALLADEE